MFNYFRNYSSNAHQVCCEDNLTKGLYDHCQSDDLDLHSRSQVRLKLDYFLACNISDNNVFVSHHIQTWHDGRLMDAIYAHAHFDDLYLAARSQWVCKVKTSQRCMMSATKQAINVKLATTTVDHSYVTLTLQTFTWLDQLVSFFRSLLVQVFV